jgi:hypothetical protein
LTNLQSYNPKNNYDEIDNQIFQISVQLRELILIKQEAEKNKPHLVLVK